MYQEALIKFTGDLSYQEHMIEDYPFYAKRLKILVVRSVGRTPQNLKTVNFLKQVRLTGDLSYQEQMFQDYPHYADYLRPHAVRSISRTPSNIARINFFKQVILVDANDEAVLEAADTLLNMLGVPSSSDGEIQHYQCLQDRLCSQSGQDKLDAFTKLEKYMYPDNS